jgi:hypothetical protein
MWIPQGIPISVVWLAKRNWIGDGLRLVAEVEVVGVGVVEGLYLSRRSLLFKVEVAAMEVEAAMETEVAAVEVAVVYCACQPQVSRYPMSGTMILIRPVVIFSQGV